MRISLIGNGKMAKAVQARALQEGHRIVRVLERRDNPLGAGFTGAWVGETDVLIDFSHADAVPSNVANAVAAGIPLVEGVTGWHNQMDDVRRRVVEGGGCCVHSSNFSIGVQAFFRLVREAGRIFSQLEGYAPFIEERHHERKKDAPSGTALTLQGILGELGRTQAPVCSVRAGFIPGTHEVGFDSIVDTVTLTHTARSRDGFAAGALHAAAWTRGKRGFFDLQEVLFHESQ